jgi:hypothetical protein
MAKSHDLDTTAVALVEKAAAYLVKHTRLLHYDRALADGLPIATGVIEGACRYLVQDRMGRTGSSARAPRTSSSSSGSSARSGPRSRMSCGTPSSPGARRPSDDGRVEARGARAAPRATGRAGTRGWRRPSLRSRGAGGAR